MVQKWYSKKEEGASVFSTLAAYGVSSGTLATTTITIVNEIEVFILGIAYSNHSSNSFLRVYDLVPCAWY
jgi:hypothetical protein